MLPVAMNETNSVALPQDMLAEFSAYAENDFNDFSNGSVRRLKVERMNFAIKGSGDSNVVPFDKLIGVCLAVAKYNHCVWYARDYTPGMEPERPDLCWVQRTDNFMPESLPKEFHTKIMRNGAERWAYQRMRRTVWAFFHEDASGQPMLDLDNPVVFDVTSMSLWGSASEKEQLYKWSGIIQMCRRMSTQQAPVLPMMFPIQIVPDGSVSVLGVVSFRPILGPNGYPRFFDVNTLSAIAEKRRSMEVQDLLEIEERLEYNGVAAQPAAPVQAVKPAQVVKPPKELLAEATAALEQTKAEPAKVEPVKQAEPAKVEAAPSELNNLFSRLGM